MPHKPWTLTGVSQELTSHMHPPSTRPKSASPTHNHAQQLCTSQPGRLTCCQICDLTCCLVQPDLAAHQARHAQHWCGLQHLLQDTWQLVSLNSTHCLLEAVRVLKHQLEPAKPLDRIGVVGHRQTAHTAKCNSHSQSALQPGRRVITSNNKVAAQNAKETTAASQCAHIPTSHHAIEWHSEHLPAAQSPAVTCTP